MKAAGLLWLCPLLAWGGAFERGVALKTAGDLPGATRELAAATRENPRNVEAWFHYGVVLGWQERHVEARAALERGLAIAPKDYDLRLARARVIAWQGDYATASRELAQLASENPADDDVRVLQGRVANWQGKPDEAEAHYRAVLARNPKQIDALTGMGDLARTRRQTHQAKDYYQQALAVEDSTDTRKKLEDLENEKLMRVDFGVTGSTFAGSERSDWWSVWTQVSRVTAWGNVWGRIEQGERFDDQDTQLEVGIEGVFADDFSGRIFAGGSPDANWAPEWYAEGGVKWLPEAGWPSPALEIRHAQYVPRGVWTFRLGFDHDFGNGWTGSARWVHQDFENGEPTDGWILSLDKVYDSGFGWRIGMASGAESLDGQTLEDDDILRSQTYFAGIRGIIGDNWGWRFDFEFEDVDGGIDRRGVSLGFYHRF